MELSRAIIVILVSNFLMQGKVLTLCFDRSIFFFGGRSALFNQGLAFRHIVLTLSVWLSGKLMDWYRPNLKPRRKRFQVCPLLLTESFF